MEKFYIQDISRTFARVLSKVNAYKDIVLLVTPTKFLESNLSHFRLGYCDAPKQFEI